MSHRWELNPIYGSLPNRFTLLRVFPSARRVYAVVQGGERIVSGCADYGA